MTQLAEQLAAAWHRLGRRLKGAEAGWWGLASDASGMTAAHVLREADGTLQLSALKVLSPDGEPPARRAADVARAVSDPRAPCAIVLPPEDYKIHFMPGLPVAADERNDALRWKLKDELEFPPDEAVIDSVSASVSNQIIEHGLWLVVMARRKRVFDIVTPLSRTGARVEAVDVAELAQRNLAAACVPAGRTVAMLSMDSRRGLLTVSRDDGVYATRQFDPLAVALAGADYDRRQSLIERLALELQRTFDNIERQYGAGPIDKVVLLCDPPADDVLRTLAASLPNPVEIFAAGALLSADDPKLIERASQSMTACLAIGAAMRPAPGASA